MSFCLGFLYRDWRLRQAQRIQAEHGSFHADDNAWGAGSEGASTEGDSEQNSLEGLVRDHGGRAAGAVVPLTPIVEESTPTSPTFPRQTEAGMGTRVLRSLGRRGGQ